MLDSNLKVKKHRDGMKVDVKNHANRRKTCSPSFFCLDMMLLLRFETNWGRFASILDFEKNWYLAKSPKAQ